MIKRVVFFNKWHYGDQHVSKEFVKFFVKQFEKQGIECFYATNKSKHSVNIDMNIDHLSKYQDINTSNVFNEHSFLAPDGTYYLNTWVGHYITAWQHNFVNQMPMWKDLAFKVMLSSYGNTLLNFPTRAWDMVSEIDENLISEVNIPDGKNALLCNNPSVSLKTFETDLFSVVDKISDDFKEINFITTKRINLKKPNVIYVGDLIDREDTDNLPEIGYLAGKCEFVVSNSSGPGTFSINKGSLGNRNAKIISFASTESNSLFHELDNISAKTYWNPNSSDSNVYNTLKEIIKMG